MGAHVVNLLIVLGSAVAAAATAVLVRRRRIGHGDVADTMPLGMAFTIVAGLHGVLAMFVLIGLLDAANTTREAAHREADSLVAAVWAAEALPRTARDHVREQARDYAAVVIYREWPQLQTGTPVDQSGWQLLQDLRHTVSQAVAETEMVQDRRDEASELVVQTYQARQARLTVGTQTVPPLLWFVLAVSTASVFGLSCLFGADNVAGFVTMVAVMGAMLATLLVAIVHLQAPLGASGGVAPDAFHSVLDRLDSRG